MRGEDGGGEAEAVICISISNYKTSILKNFHEQEQDRKM